MLKRYGTTQGVRLENASSEARAQQQWLREACPFEETRHSCFFFGQPDALQIGRRAMRLLDNDVSAEQIIGGLAGKKIFFMGDSVLRQLMQASSCKLSGQLVRDGLVWTDPMKRRHPSYNYAGICPFSKGKHCELRTGCATFAAKVTLCYSNLGFRTGWEALNSEFVKVGGADVVVFSSGHHHQPAAQLPMWDSPAARSARDELLASARKRGSRLVLQAYESQHFPGGKGDYDAARHHGRVAVPTRSCEALDESRAEETAAAAVSSDPRARRGAAKAAGPAARDRSLERLAARASSHAAPAFNASGEGTGAYASTLDLERTIIVPPLVAGGGELLATHAISAAAWWAHSHGAPTASRTTDCTHWCMPGIPDVWAGLLFAQLLPKRPARAFKQGAA